MMHAPNRKEAYEHIGDHHHYHMVDQYRMHGNKGRGDYGKYNEHIDGNQDAIAATAMGEAEPLNGNREKPAA